MKKNKILFLVVVILFVGIAIYGYFISRDQSEKSNEPSSQEKKQYTQSELEDMALTYFISQNSPDVSDRSQYSVGSIEDTEESGDTNTIVIEIRHVHNGNNTLDARYYIDSDTAKGRDDMGNVVDLNTTLE